MRSNVYLFSKFLNPILIACSFGLLPLLDSHDSSFAIVNWCCVVGAFTITLKFVAGPGDVSISPQRLNSATPSTEAS